jgi:hypothetical protein
MQNLQLIEEVEKMFDGFNKDKSRQQVRGDKQGDPTNINNQNSFVASDAGLAKGG